MRKVLINEPNRINRGFTLTELVIVITVISILTSISFVSYGSWKKTTITNRLKSDLSAAASAMENYRNFNNTYPTTVPTTFRSSQAVTIAGGGMADGKNYCISATDSSDASLVFHIDSYSTGKSVQAGVCVALVPPVTPITAIAAITGTPQTGQTLTAGAITPAGATVSYQWQSSTTAGGTYTNINGATASTYAVSPATIGKYIKVVVTGTGTYTGIQTSAASTQVAADSNWLTVGSQTWAKANLNIGTRVAGTTAQTNNAITEKYCYNDTESNCTTNGGLYQWDEAMNYSTTEKAQGICPVGSHIPSDNEWKTLEMSLSGMTQTVADTTGWRGTDEGTKLKSGGSSGLNMPLGGNSYQDGSFTYLGLQASLWSSSELSTSLWVRNLASGGAAVYRTTYAKEYAHGLSVRCVGN